MFDRKFVLLRTRARNSLLWSDWGQDSTVISCVVQAVVEKVIAVGRKFGVRRHLLPGCPRFMPCATAPLVLFPVWTRCARRCRRFARPSELPSATAEQF